MPEKKTQARARKAKAEGKAPSTQAGEYVREEVHHIREGKHGAKSAKQAIAIGLSKARKAGVRIPKRKSAAKRRSSKHPATGASPSRSRAATTALKREGTSAASHRALSKQARSAAAKRPSRSRSAAAKKAAATRRANQSRESSSS